MDVDSDDDDGIQYPSDYETEEQRRQYRHVVRASLADQHDREQLRRMHSSRPDFGPSAYEEGGGSGSRRPSRDVGADVGGSGDSGSCNSRFWWGRSRGG